MQIYSLQNHETFSFC